MKKGPVSIKQLVKALQKWYKQLQAVDPTLIIYEFEKDLPTKAVLTSKQVPTDINQLKNFFSNISVQPQGGHTWFQLWAGHYESTENLVVNMKYWSKENDTYLYEKRLQEKLTAKDH